MKLPFFALFLLASQAVVIAAGQPKAVIDGPIHANPGSAVFLDGRRSFSDADRPLKWKLLNSDALFITFDKDGRKDVVAMLAAAEAGRTYRFVLVAVAKVGEPADYDVDVAIHEVVVDGAPNPNPFPPPNPTPIPVPPPSPTPTPDPIPDPPPAPSPLPQAKGTLWITYVKPANPKVADVRPEKDLSIENSLAVTGSQWRCVTEGDSELSNRKLDIEIKETGYPVTLFQDLQPGSNVAKVIYRLPGNDPQKIADTIKALKGVK